MEYKEICGCAFAKGPDKLPRFATPLCPVCKQPLLVTEKEYLCPKCSVHENKEHVDLAVKREKARIGLS